MKSMEEEIPKDFNWQEYISLYPDLKVLKTKEEAEGHWKRHGKKEGRVYKKSQIIPIPSTFNWKEYVCLNEDLTDTFDEESAITHWKHFGYKEKRIISKKAFFEKFPFFDSALYSQYLRDFCEVEEGLLSEDMLIRLFFENPLIFRKIDDKVYHAEVLFVKECAVEKIKDQRLIELNEMHLCCRPCFERMHLIQQEPLPEVEDYYSIVKKRLKKKEFKYVVNFNICLFLQKNFYLTADKIEEFKELDTLLVVTMRQGLSNSSVQKIITLCKKFKNYVLLKFNNMDNYLDIPFLYVSHNFLEKNKISYKIIFTVHSKRSTEHLIKLLEVLDDEAGKRLEIMLSKDIYYLYSSERAFPMDLRNFRVISKLYPQTYKNKYIRFCAGTIFLARKELFDKLFQVIPIDKKNIVRFNRRYFSNEMSFSTNLDDTVERLFGILNYFHFSSDFLVVFAVHISSMLKLEVLKININMLLAANLRNILLVYSIPEPEEVYRSFSQSLENYLSSLKLGFVHVEKVGNHILADLHKYRVATEVIQKLYFSKFRHFIFMNDSIIVTDSSGKFLKEFSDFCRDTDLTGLVSSRERKYHYQTHMFGCNRLRKLLNFFNKFSNSASVKDLELSLYEFFSNDCRCFIDTSKLSDKNPLYFCDNIYFELLLTNRLPIIKLKRLLFEKILNDRVERRLSDQDEFKYFESIKKSMKEPQKIVAGVPEPIYRKLEDENLTYILKYV